MRPKSSTGRSTIKNDPFAAVIPSALEPVEIETSLPAAEPSPKEAEPNPAGPTPEKVTAPARTPARLAKAGRQKLTVHLPSDLAERVKNAAYWNPRLTIAGIAEQGIRSVIEKVEREQGGRYPPREGELIGGRPIK